MNEHLQAAIDYKRVWFPCPLTSHDDYEGVVSSTNAEMVNELCGYKEVYEFVADQDELINQVKKQCALVEVKVTALGTQSFDLPQHLKRNKSSNRARKDNYTALLLVNWGMKIYNTLQSSEFKRVNTTFTPLMFGRR